jgi:hypothetical protein
MPLIKLNATQGLTGTLPAVSGANLTNIDGGKVLQVVTATDETPRTTTSTSYVTASNAIAVTITPTSTSSKIFVIMSTTVSSPSNTYAGHITIYRGSTNLATNQFINAHGTTTYQVEGGAISVLDSPNTTSATTYQVYIKVQGGAPNGVTINHGTSKGTITAFEIGA